MRTYTDKTIRRDLPKARSSKKKVLKQAKKSEMVTMSRWELEQMQMKWTKRAFSMTLYFSIMSLRDGFGFGKERLERFATKFFSHYAAYDSDMVEVDDMRQVIFEETGFKIGDSEELRWNLRTL